MSEQDREPRPIILLEDRLEEMDDNDARGVRWWGRQRLGHAVGSLVTTMLLLAWVLYTSAPGLAHRLVHALPLGR